MLSVSSTLTRSIKAILFQPWLTTEVRERALGTPEICVGYATDLVWYTITERLVTELCASLAQVGEHFDVAKRGRWFESNMMH